MYMPDMSGIAYPEPEPELSEAEKKSLQDQIALKLRERNAVLIAHYYTAPEVQELADKTGGFIGDSLEMARWGKNAPAETLLVAGVRFMGETAKILSPEKTVLMPDLGAECSLDLGCPAPEFQKLREEEPDRVAVVYANTSAAVKALSDYVATSSCAIDLIHYLDLQGKKILWAPDRHLGAYVAQETGADMLRWQAHCVVHDSFKEDALRDLKAEHPDAAVMVHPEAPAAVTAMADFAGSTSQILNKVREMDRKEFIIATETGIFYKISQACPDKVLIPAPTGGHGATCQSCAHCPWMRMSALPKLLAALESSQGHNIEVPEDIRKKALLPVQRMLDFNQALKKHGSVEEMVRAGVRI
ncbi:MAG: quinolinate synthase NadA [Succinimonas sp.]|nr:quinolinate synthase NadA [Succinimonas sp.]